MEETTATPAESDSATVSVSRPRTVGGRRWLQFSLRSFLLFTALVAMLCGLYVGLPFATFTEGRAGQFKTLTIETTYPMNSVLFDANYQLVENDRIAEWQQGWLEPKNNGVQYTSWNRIVLKYQEDWTPKCLILHCPYFGYRYYQIEHTPQGMKFYLRPMPQKWREAMSR